MPRLHSALECCRLTHSCKSLRPWPNAMDRSPGPILAPEPAWRRDTPGVSLPEVHRSIVVPKTASFWRKLFAFAGPGFLVSVGYMDPANSATDLSAGAQFGYTLLCIVMLSNLMAILLQHLSIKLGVATGRDR